MLLIFLYSLLSAALSDYWLFKHKILHLILKYLENIGILKIFQMVASIGGGISLSKTRKSALKEAENIRRKCIRTY